MNDRTTLPVLSYTDGRDKIQDGDLIICHGHKPLHKAIQFFSGSYWNHVAFVYWWNDRAVVLESGEHGVSTLALSRFLQTYPGEVILARCSEVDATNVEVILDVVIDKYLGADYDTWTLLRLALRKALGKLGCKWAAPINNRWYCSELVRDALSAVGIVINADAQGMISPGMIANHSTVSLIGRLAI